MTFSAETNRNQELRQALRDIATRIEAHNARIAALPNDTTAINNTTIKTLLTI